MNNLFHRRVLSIIAISTFGIGIYLIFNIIWHSKDATEFINLLKGDIITILVCFMFTYISFKFQEGL